MSLNSKSATRSNNKRRQSASNNNDSNASSRKKRSTCKQFARAPRRPADRGASGRPTDRNARSADCSSRRSSGKDSFEDKAPPANNPHKLPGSRLELTMTNLALQPDKLQTTIIEQLNLMLNLRNVIQQHNESLLQFDKPVSVPSAAMANRDKLRAPQGFIPNSARLKNPINSSKNYKDDERIKAKEDKTQ